MGERVTTTTTNVNETVKLGIDEMIAAVAEAAGVPGATVKSAKLVRENATPVDLLVKQAEGMTVEVVFEDEAVAENDPVLF